ncbi:hypothetical protein [Pseudomonas qingdaonensis]|uniref:hypothetical protein n=1 Tax=Pseudomonas qingdaonensis TaxID=2056231 RepID=UPI001F3BE63F|nr:hypothetical protein [Pseudomonas qingdaonensis]
MKFEKPQTGNPHRLTVNQHVFPKSCISRFCNSDGVVQLFSRKLGRVIELAPGNDFFCVKRMWDQSAEAGIGKRAEDRFVRLARGIISGSVKTVGVFEKAIVEEFFSLWRTRHKFKVEGLPDIKLEGLSGDQLTKDEQEILESKHVSFMLEGVMPGRFAASIHLFGFHQQFAINNHQMQWGIVRAGQGEFIVPDCFQDMMVIPLTPTIAIAADQSDSVLTIDEVATVNQLALTRVTDYFFARNFSRCPVIKRSPPRLQRMFVPD